jgi:K+-sensing histidine kinase KdpD
MKNSTSSAREATGLAVLFPPKRRGKRHRLPRGHGLGLYVVQQIVQAHDGTIKVEWSAELDTTFSVRLPRHPISRPSQDRSTAHERESISHKLKILSQV